MAGKGDLFMEALKAEGVTGPLANLARSIYMQESGGGRNTKTSNAGAVGGMQIIPSTFKAMADEGWDINDPMLNARAGIRYLKQLDKSAGGDPTLTAVGYYGGPGAMAKARKGVAVSDPRNPNAPNTLQYAEQVVARMGGKPVSPLALPDNKVAGVRGIAGGAAMLPARSTGEEAGIPPLKLASLERPDITLPPPAPVPMSAQAQAVEAPAPEQDAWGQMAAYVPRQYSPQDFNFGPVAAPEVNITRPAWYRKI